MIYSNCSDVHQGYLSDRSGPALNSLQFDFDLVCRCSVNHGTIGADIRLGRHVICQIDILFERERKELIIASDANTWVFTKL